MPFARRYWMLRIIAVLLGLFDRQPGRLEEGQMQRGVISAGAGTLPCTLFTQQVLYSAAAAVPGRVLSKAKGLDWR